MFCCYLGPHLVFWDAAVKSGSTWKTLWSWTVGGAGTVWLKGFCPVTAKEAPPWDFRRWWKSQVHNQESANTVIFQCFKTVCSFQRIYFRRYQHKNDTSPVILSRTILVVQVSLRWSTGHSGINSDGLCCMGSQGSRLFSAQVYK